MVDEPRKWGHTRPETPETGHYVIFWAYTHEDDKTGKENETDFLSEITAIRDETVVSIGIYPNYAESANRVKVDDLVYLGMNKVNRTHTWAYTPE